MTLCPSWNPPISARPPKAAGVERVRPTRPTGTLAERVRRGALAPKAWESRSSVPRWGPRTRLTSCATALRMASLILMDGIAAPGMAWRGADGHLRRARRKDARKRRRGRAFTTRYRSSHIRTAPPPLLSKESELFLRHAIREAKQETVFFRLERAPCPTGNGMDVLRTEVERLVRHQHPARSLGRRHHHAVRRADRRRHESLRNVCHPRRDGGHGPPAVDGIGIAERDRQVRI